MSVRLKPNKLLLLIAAGFMLVGAACGNTATDKKGAEEQFVQSDTRIVSTIKGDVEIPSNPKRIAALYYHHLLLAMDVKPVGANLTWWGGSPYLSELEADGIVDVGGPPSLEAITALDPDLIIANDNNLDDYDQLSKIAPTVLIPYDAARSVYEDADLIGELLGKPAIGAELLSAFEAKATAAKARLTGVADENTKAAIIRIEDNGGLFAIFGENYGRGGWAIYEGLKFQKPAKIQEELDKSGLGLVQQLPLELLPEYVADADYIFISNEGIGVDQVANDAVWNSIPAFQNDRVIELDSKQYFYFDPISINGQVDEITELLLSKP